MVLFREDEVKEEEVKEEVKEELNEELAEEIEKEVEKELAEEVEEVAEEVAEEAVAEAVKVEATEEVKNEVSADLEKEVEKVEAQEETQLEKEVNALLKELEEIEKSLGMQSNFSDEDFPPFKPVILPTFNMPLNTGDGNPPLTRADIAKLNDEQFNALMEKLRKVEHLEAQVEAMKNIIDDRLSVDFRAMYENILEKTNIEAIKTYRNLQAVIIEENSKQNQALFGIDNKSNSLKKRMNNVLMFAVVSFVVSILVMLMQILPALGIKLF